MLSNKIIFLWLMYTCFENVVVNFKVMRFETLTRKLRRLEGLGKFKKNPTTSSGIGPATFRFVA
jgi:hypothetical protein